MSDRVRDEEVLDVPFLESVEERLTVFARFPDDENWRHYTTLAESTTRAAAEGWVSRITKEHANNDMRFQLRSVRKTESHTILWKDNNDG